MKKIKQLFIELVVIMFLLLPQVLNAKWESKINGLPEAFTAGFAMDACNPQTAIIDISIWNEGSKLFCTTNGGDNWYEIDLPEEVTSTIDISMVDSDHFWVCSGGGYIAATSDGGLTWELQYYNPEATSFVNYIEMFDLSHGIAMADNINEGEPAVFLRTIDGGLNWVSMNDSAFGHASGDTWRRVHFPSSNVGYFFESGVNPQGLYKTEDGGSTWEKLDYPGLYITVLRFYDENIGLAAYTDSLVYRTIDGGKTWKRFIVSNDSKWGHDIEFAVGDPSKVWYASRDNLFFSNDTGKTWFLQYEVNAWDIKFLDSKNGFLLGENSVYLTTNSGNSSVDYANPITPTDLLLFQNYPNPFNNMTTIKFVLERMDEIDISIYDVLGRENKIIEKKLFSSGLNIFQFDAIDYSSGTYIIRLKTKVNGVRTKKITLQK